MTFPQKIRNKAGVGGSEGKGGGGLDPAINKRKGVLEKKWKKLPGPLLPLQKNGRLGPGAGGAFSLSREGG